MEARKNKESLEGKTDAEVGGGKTPLKRRCRTGSWKLGWEGRTTLQ